MEGLIHITHIHTWLKGRVSHAVTSKKQKVALGWLCICVCVCVYVCVYVCVCVCVRVVIAYRHIGI
jgi:hypothetical protein